MTSFFTIEHLREILEGAHQWFLSLTSYPEAPRQCLIAAFAIGLGYGVGTLLKRYLLERFGQPSKASIGRFIVDRLGPAAGPLMAFFFLCILWFWAEERNVTAHVLGLAVKLTGAWVAARLLAGIFAGETTAIPLTVLIWLVIALDIIGALDPLILAFDRMGFTLDNERISFLALLKAIFLLSLLWAVFHFLGEFIRTQLARTNRITPRLQILGVKLLKVMLFCVGVLVAMDSVGLDFHLLALFSGALGLGLGFGLQKVVSNLVSGIILLLDNSIRPGDVIQVEGVCGWIQSLKARYVSMVTRDGTSYLIPNDELIHQRVINWTHSDRAVRIKIPLCVGYDSDLNLAMGLMSEAALKFDRALKNPPPEPRLMGFGDNGINLELRLWIEDPEKGLTNIKSDIQLDIWDQFRAHGIEFPYPQRDVRIRETAGTGCQGMDPGGKS